MNEYFSIRIFVEQFPDEIDNTALLTIADKICEYLKCQYTRLGYSLLHPDFDYKDVGIIFKNNRVGKEKFTRLIIPSLFFGNCEIPDAPVIKFEMLPKNRTSLSDFSIVVRYPVLKSSPLIIAIDIKESLVQRSINSTMYADIVNLFYKYDYVVNTAFLHCYRGELKRLLLDGGSAGFCTFRELRLIDKVAKHQANYKNKMIDVFRMNTISKKAISDSFTKKIISIVGEENIIESDSIITFSLPQKLPTHLTNYYLQTYYKCKIKRLLKEEIIID